MNYDCVCECGSTENLSKHITTISGHVSLNEPMCESCRNKLRNGVRQLYTELQPWYKPIDEQMEYLKSLLA